MYDKFLLFSNLRTLYVINFESFAKSPDWFTPSQVKSIELDPLMNYYSKHLFQETYSIVHINAVDHCMDHISVFIHTEFSGTLMLEIEKAAFYYDEWIYAPVNKEKTHELTSAESLGRYKYKVTNLEEADIISNGKLLMNYYYYNYTDSEI